MNLFVVFCLLSTLDTSTGFLWDSLFGGDDEAANKTVELFVASTTEAYRQDLTSEGPSRKQEDLVSTQALPGREVTSTDTPGNMTTAGPSGKVHAQGRTLNPGYVTTAAAGAGKSTATADKITAAVDSNTATADKTTAAVDSNTAAADKTTAAGTKIIASEVTSTAGKPKITAAPAGKPVEVTTAAAHIPSKPPETDLLADTTSASEESQEASTEPSVTDEDTTAEPEVVDRSGRTGNQSRTEGLGTFEVRGDNVTRVEDTTYPTFMVRGSTVTQVKVSTQARVSGPDPCETADCEHQCEATTTGYRCRCDAGFRLTSDNRTCQDIDECGERNGQCELGCTNTAGSYLCSCSAGFQLSNNRHSCSDVDECVNETTHQCPPDYSCVNSLGRYICLRTAPNSILLKEDVVMGVLTWLGALTGLLILCISLLCVDGGESDDISLAFSPFIPKAFNNEYMTPSSSNQRKLMSPDDPSYDLPTMPYSQARGLRTSRSIAMPMDLAQAYTPAPVPLPPVLRSMSRYHRQRTFSDPTPATGAAVQAPPSSNMADNLLDGFLPYVDSNNNTSGKPRTSIYERRKSSCLSSYQPRGTSTSYEPGGGSAVANTPSSGEALDEDDTNTARKSSKAFFQVRMSNGMTPSAQENDVGTPRFRMPITLPEPISEQQSGQP